MFEKLKRIYEKIIKAIIPKKRIYQLETSSLEKEEQLINEKEKNQELKMQIYPFDEKEAQNILKEIQKEDTETNINIEEIKKNYSKYKAIQEQGKIKWLKSRIDNIPLDDYIGIISAISKEDMKYISDTFGIGVKLVTKAIYSMGINIFMQLKENGELKKFLNIENYIKIVGEMTQEEKELLLAFRKNDLGEHIVNQFYLYYDFIKENEPEKVNMLLTNNTDEVNYIHHKTNDGKSGYKWVEDILVVPPAYKMIAIKNMDTKLILDIRENSKIPLNVITTAMLELDLFEENNRDDLEKILLNYYKFNLDIAKQKDKEQLKRLLLNLPENLSTEYETIIKDCTVGRLKRFKLDKFEQIENFEKICNEKILQEFEANDNISELRKMILETKIKDINAIKRDIYFYKKYTQQENETVKLFESLLGTQEKEELLKSYKKLNEISAEFDLDNALNDIRNTLSEISKEDVVSKMNEMEEKIQNAKTQNIDGQEVINLTGTEFNLLISVIGASGSPYLVRYYNNQIDKLRKVQNNKILFSILKRTDDIRTRLGIKRLVNRRFKIDPLKNKQRCVSSIDEDFLGHVQSEKYSEEGEKRQIEEKLILAYFPQNKTDITCMGNQDLMTIYDKDRSDPTRKRVPHRDNTSGICNLKLQDLNATTIGNDNELVIDSYPEAVMCFDKISNIAKKTAKKLNIPILYIDSEQQFKIIKEKTDKYYTDMYEKILKDSQISEENFDEAFNVFEQNNNIIHRAFKMAHGFGYLDDEDYPKEQIIEVFEAMTNLVQ